MQKAHALGVITNHQRLNQRLMLCAASIHVISALITDYIRVLINANGAMGMGCLVATAKTGLMMTLNVITAMELDLNPKTKRAGHVPAFSRPIIRIILKPRHLFQRIQHRSSWQCKQLLRQYLLDTIQISRR